MKLLLSILAILVLTPALLLGLVAMSTEVIPRLVRPDGVPYRARYVSAFKFSGYFDCSIDEARNVNWCRVWDHRGRLWADGPFRLKDEGRAATANELRPSTIGATNQAGQTDEIYLFGEGDLILGPLLVRVTDAASQTEQE